jgi:hypothetical protein
MISLVAFGAAPWRPGRSLLKILLDIDARFIEAVLMVSGSPNLFEQPLRSTVLFFPKCSTICSEKSGGVYPKGSGA